MIRKFKIQFFVGNSIAIAMFIEYNLVYKYGILYLALYIVFGHIYIIFCPLYNKFY
jgi:hypothetical protein